MPTEKVTLVSIKMRDPFLNAVDLLARRRGVSRSTLVRDVLVEEMLRVGDETRTEAPARDLPNPPQATS
jgi:metal-responsive CopG/Arc/MetJ family transcriptional regulator